LGQVTGTGRLARDGRRAPLAFAREMPGGFELRDEPVEVVAVRGRVSLEDGDEVAPPGLVRVHALGIDDREPAGRRERRAEARQDDRKVNPVNSTARGGR